MTELNCRLVALFTLAVSLIYLGSAVFFRHRSHHKSDERHHTSESLSTDYESDVFITEPASTIPTPSDRPHDFLITETCLQCICEAATDCKPAKCGTNRQLCGVFGISMAYWKDAERKQLDGPEALNEYYEAVNNPFYAGRVVENYVSRYRRDCNKDGRIDCYDYAMLHVLGPTGCRTSELPALTYTRLHRCMEKFSLSLPPDKP